MPFQGTTGEIDERAIMFDDAFERLPSEIEAVEIRVAPFERGQNAQSLGVMIKAAAVGETAIKRALASVAKRWMAEIVRQRAGFGQIFVKPEDTSQRPCNLGHFQSVSKARAKMITFVNDENLRLIS